MSCICGCVLKPLTSAGGDRIIVVKPYCALPLYGIEKIKFPSVYVGLNSKNLPCLIVPRFDNTVRSTSYQVLKCFSSILKHCESDYL